MLQDLWWQRVANFLNQHSATLMPSDFNAKTEATYNDSRRLNGKGATVISECGHNPKGCMDHFGYNGCHPMTDEELEAERVLIEGVHFAQN